MTASIYEGADGRWHGRVTMGVRDDGRPDRRHVSAKTEAEVIRKVRELEKDRDAGRTKRPGRAWTVEKWLDHWLENIAAGSVRPKTYAGYQTAVRRHLIPGLGGHRTDRLQAEHIEKLYAAMRAKKLKAGTVHHAHRTLRAALNEAVRRGQIVKNPVLVARPPRLQEEEIEPLTVEEAQRVLAVAARRRNGVRYAVALSIGLRQGEALGLKWADVNEDAGTLAIRRALQRHTWRHGCGGECGKKRGADCPSRYGGGLAIVDTKSRAGRRVVGVPRPLMRALTAHRIAQQAERERAGSLWADGGWVFAQPTGKPLDPRADYEEWRELLKAAKVRPARLHDARHTAATMLLVLKVPTRAVMDVMGWSNASMAGRYQHVPAEVLTGIARQVGGLLWAADDDQNEDDEDGDSVAV
ncbi:tyrosine-type recombinase/integrase [Spirilliplanes yamanashiensis]|uniref:tyrosine-type recombinase/integrase n=1 Tax=Spirilliplanes yamanashiensis TaxID=42233 RepID=UPI00277F8000|nr:site-specific integrase [Spirilliplanes yamanashiensis]MDP9815179.1 integrase [Spirilliplanes yamanashiensis]